MHRLQELVRLHRQGVGPRRVAKLLRMSTRTEIKYRKALEDAGLLDGDPEQLPELASLRDAVEQRLPTRSRPQNQSSITHWTPRITALMEKGAGPRAIFDLLDADSDFHGSYSAVKRLCRKIKRDQPPKPQDVAIPVVTAPGEVAQVDFGYLGKLLDPVKGTLRRAYVFVMVLGFSRMMYAEIVFDQRVSTWLRLHANAFKFFGGVPRTIVPDNLKSAVIQASFSLKEDPVLNRSYRELARHYGFQIDPTPPYAPQKKGKVESGVKYVKGNFFTPRDFLDANDAQHKLVDWNERIASQRCHGTTFEKPQDRFNASERAALLPLPAGTYEWLEWHPSTVRENAHVLFERRFYSVPWQLLGQAAIVRASDHTVAIYVNDERVATHPRGGEGNYSTVAEHLPAERAELRQRSLDYWRERAAAKGDEVASFIDAIIEQADGQSPLRRVQSILQLLDKYPSERACAACLRAAAFGNYTWKGLNKILRENLDHKPVQTAQMYTHGQLSTARFARSIHELLPIN